MLVLFLAAGISMRVLIVRELSGMRSFLRFQNWSFLSKAQALPAGISPRFSVRETRWATVQSPSPQRREAFSVMRLSEDPLPVS
ncbi:hypothetical protein J2847_004385 [Azospirillum agricola]|uniref:hypothetical protein n=1 Tax=Azospirillum agricola TaxID=1720247 RepID=UPI001AE9CEA3|nr:hypothetical protein [Azospirillum agricola]MBP2231074.1 hypothetical protein [Azospirillum agricola]